MVSVGPPALLILFCWFVGNDAGGVRAAVLLWAIIRSYRVCWFVVVISETLTLSGRVVDVEEAATLLVDDIVCNNGE